MKRNPIPKLCACSLGLILFCTGFANAGGIDRSIQSPETGNFPTLQQQQVLQELRKADVVYLGETHTSVEDHQAQFEIIRELHRQNPKIAIAMEMFQRPYQSAIDRYLRGELTEEQLVEQTEYNQRWGFPWEYYAPILRFARENQLPAIALNTPTKVTRKVARQGLESLTEKERQYIPPLDEIRTDNAEYRQMVRESFEQHMTGGHGSSVKFENFFLAQVLWDETMAEAIAEFIKANPDYQVVVLAGQGHVVYGYGIPSRVARRLGDRELVQRSLLFLSAEEVRYPRESAIADYFWRHE